MSIPKGKRNKSKVDFDDLFFKVANNTANVVENHFGIDEVEYMRHRMYIDYKGAELLQLVNHILRYIRMANAFPTCRKEYETRRDCNACRRTIVTMDKLFKTLFPHPPKYKRRKRDEVINETFKEATYEDLRHQR